MTSNRQEARAKAQRRSTPRLRSTQGREIVLPLPTAPETKFKVLEQQQAGGDVILR
jgi:hypothetical protein